MSRFPDVPTIRLIEFPYLPVGRRAECGRHFIFFGRAPLGRRGLIRLDSLAWLRSAKPTCRLKSVSWLRAPTD